MTYKVLARHFSDGEGFVVDVCYSRWQAIEAAQAFLAAKEGRVAHDAYDDLQYSGQTIGDEWTVEVTNGDV